MTRRPARRSPAPSSRGSTAGTRRAGRVAGLHLLAVLALVATSGASITLAQPEEDDVEEAIPAAGDLDVTFAGDGIAITGIGSDVEVLDAARQPVGGMERLLVLDSTGTVWRFFADGTTDVDFGNGGRVGVELPTEPTRIAAGPDGGFVVGGEGGGEGLIVLSRFLPDGTPDAAFGSNGFTTFTFANEDLAGGVCDALPLTHGADAFTDVGIRSDGTIVVAAWGGVMTLPSCMSVPGVMVFRLDATGGDLQARGATPCPDSGTSEETFVEAHSMTVTGDDRVLVSVAYWCDGDDNDDAVTVFAIDGSFAPGMLFDGSTAQQSTRRRLPIAEQPDGTVVVAAEGPDGSATWRLLRWGTGGVFETPTAEVAFPAGLPATRIGDVVVTATGRVVVVGAAAPGEELADTYALAGFSATGVPDAAPTLVSHPAGAPASGLVAAPVGAGFLVAGNLARHVFGFDQPVRQLLLTRLTATGAFDGGFGADGSGFVGHDRGSGAYGLTGAVLPDGRVLAAGSLFTYDQLSGFVLRHAFDGSLDATFRRTDLADPGAVLPGIEITRYGVAPFGGGSGDAGVAAAPQPQAPDDGPAPAVPDPPEVDEPAVTLAVTENGDDGPGSLRDAVAQADEADGPVAIVFAEGLGIGLTTGQVVYNGAHDLTLLGNGSTLYCDLETDCGRILDVVDPAATLLVQDLDFTNPWSAVDAEEGAAIRTAGDLVVVGSSFVGFEVDDVDGGAIWAAGDVAVTGSRFAQNEAWVGGAIWVGGNLTVTATEFEENGAFVHGGAVWVDDGDTAVTDSEFIENWTGTSGSPAPRTGGAIAANGAVVVTGSTFTWNDVRGQGGEDGTEEIGGGAIWSAGHVEVTASRFDQNIAADWINNGGGHGGAIRAASVRVTDSTFDDNGWTDHGGAIWVDGTAHIRGSSFTSNDALGFDSAGAVGAGGDIFVATSTFTENYSDMGGALKAFGSVHVIDSLFADNESLSWTGAGGHGGAIQADGDVLVSGSTFVNNYADGDGGAIWAAGVVGVTNSTFTSNEAGSEAGGAGGAIWGADDVLLTHVTIVDNPSDSQVAGALHSLATVFVGGAACAAVSVASAYSYETVIPPAGSTCGLTGPGDLTGFDPQLEPLQDNGGPTPTMVPGPFSPLRAAVPGAVCQAAGVTIDQRGEARPQGPLCDIGAVEQFGPGLDIEVRGLDVDSLGRIVIVGPASSQFFFGSAIMRLLPDGGPDPSFNGGVPVQLSSHDLRDVAVDALDRIVAVGNVSEEETPALRILRLTVAGDLDATFGDDGWVDLFPPDAPYWWTGGNEAVAIDDGGRILIAGWAQVVMEDFGCGLGGEFGSSPCQLLVGRLLPDGDRDTTFGSGSLLGDGVVLLTATDLVVDADDDSDSTFGTDIVARGGRILVAGWLGGSWFGTSLPPETPMTGFVMQIGDDGLPDPIFSGGTGRPGTSLPFTGEADVSVATAVALDTEGRVLVAGIGASSDGSSDILLARLRPPGQSDPVFGTDGVVRTDIGGEDAARDVLVAPDGRIVVVGHTSDVGGSRVVVARYHQEQILEGPLVAVPDPVDFGIEVVGDTSGPVTVTLRNEGGPNERVVITGITVGGMHGTDFTITATTCTLPMVLASMGSCTVTMVFTPSSGGPPVRTGELVVVTAGAAPPLRVVLVGTAAPPVVELDPEEGPIGTEVVVTGSGFDPEVEVQILIGDAVLAAVAAADVADGTFVADIEIPEGTPGGPQPVVACQRCGTEREVVGEAPFLVTPRLFVNPTLARPGSVPIATGDGFPADTPVTLRWQPGLGGGQVVADERGELRAPLLVFRRDLLGPRMLEARLAGEPDVVADAPFLAVPGSVQPGFTVRR